MSTNMLKGVVHGRTIELAEEPGLPDGQEVMVILQAAAVEPAAAQGESLRRAFGSWSEEGADLDDYLRQVRENRKVGRRPIEP
ncbi:MAG: hypothetical protein HYS13_13470 [Planctomycetia bacterium]|nr:hypothetical protein [Planctomycetia bacterium]